MFATCSVQSFSGALSREGHWWESRLWTERGTLTWLCTYLTICTNPFCLNYKTRWCWVNSQISNFSFSVFWKLPKWTKMKVISCTVMWSWKKKKRKMGRRDHKWIQRPLWKINSSNKDTQFLILLFPYLHTYMSPFGTLATCHRLVDICRLSSEEPGRKGSQPPSALGSGEERLPGMGGGIFHIGWLKYTERELHVLASSFFFFFFFQKQGRREE